MTIAINYLNAGLKECGRGLTTAKGEADNMTILSMLAAVNNTPNGRDSGDGIVNQWCAAFVNWCLGQAGIQGTGSPNGFSFQTYGAKLDSPIYGAIGITSDGHVGFYAGENCIIGFEVKLLGGNQGGGTQVQYSNYSSSAFVSWRMPPGYGY